jgi:hypothetical protein
MFGINQVAAARRDVFGGDAERRDVGGDAAIQRKARRQPGRGGSTITPLPPWPANQMKPAVRDRDR